MGGIVRASDRKWSSPSGEDPIPAAAGIGLKPVHYEALLANRPAIGFLEVDTENYMGAGGRPTATSKRSPGFTLCRFTGLGCRWVGSGR
jgi:hypothetical protein